MKKNNKVIVLIVLILVIGIGIAGYFIRKNKLDNFKANGVETTATITKLIEKRDNRISSKGNKRRSNYYAEVTYFTQNEKPDSVKNKKVIEKGKDGKYKMNLDKFKPNMGDFVLTEIPINSSQYKRLKKGDKVQVLYLKDNTESAILKEDIE